MKLNHVLIIDDDPDFRALLQIVLAKISPSSSIEQYDPVDKGNPGREFDWSKYELLLLDHELGEGEYGLDWLRKFKKDKTFPITIMLTAHGSEEIAVRALRFGAQEYINKQKLSKNRLEEAIKNAREKQLKENALINTSNLRTTIFNKEYFYNTLKGVMADEHTEHVSFLFQLWVDDYQRFYETLGLLAADQFISNIADNISALLHNDKYRINVTRIGDSAIAALVSGLGDIDAGEQIASYLCRELANKPIFHGQETIPFSVSIGAVNISKDLHSLEKLLSRADAACRSAQKDGGNTFFIHTDMPARKDKKMAVQEREPKKKRANTKPPARPDSNMIVEKGIVERAARFDLQEVIKQNRLQPYFQPLVAMSDTATLFDAEFMQLRVKLIDQQGNIFNADDLKQEDFNKGDRALLDRWLIRNGLGKLLSANKGGRSLKYGLVIPLSSESLTTTEMNDWMAKLILVTKSSNIASTTVFEIRPMDYLASKDSASAVMNVMRDKWGISFALTGITNVKVLKTCLQLGGFEFVKIPLIKEKMDNVRQMSEFSRELGSLIILDNIADGEGLLYAGQANSDYVIGDFLQPPQDDLVIMSDAIEVTG